MKELINISKQQINHETVDTVSARELHKFLESKQDFSTWVKNRIETCRFVENRDYVVFHKIMENPTGGRPSIEYHLTLETAKHFAMLERNDKGFQIRDYFIECEKQLKNLKPTIKPFSAEDIIRGIQVAVEFTSLSPDAKEALLMTSIEDNLGIKIPYRPVIEQKTYSASEIGEMMGISTNKVGKLANAHGLKTPAYGKVYLSKSPHSVKQVETFRYYSNVIPVLQALI